MKNFVSLTPRIRVEVYIPIRYETSYQDSLAWVIEELTEVYGGCTVNENVGGYFFSRSREVIDDRVNIVYSDLSLDWSNQTERVKALGYCVKLKQFLLETLLEEEILVSAYPVSHMVARSSA